MPILAGATDRTRSRVSALFVVVAASCCGCGDGGTCPEQGYALEQPLEAHACGHVADGPFETVAAAPTPAGAPELRNTHVAYTVELLPDGDAYRGFVTFRPRSTAAFVFFLDREPPLQVAAPDGSELCAAAVRSTTDTCEDLARADFYDLERLEVYTLALGPIDAAEVLVIVEAKDEI